MTTAKKKSPGRAKPARRPAGGRHTRHAAKTTPAARRPRASAATAATPAPPTVPAAPPPEAVKVAAAKGRPMLTWVGKRPLSHVTAFPAQHVERFELAAPPTPEAWRDWPASYPAGGLLFHGDNKEVLAHLLANGFRGKVNLVYIDPPFDSGADYVRKVSLRGPKGSAKVEGETYTLGEQIQYTDIWANDNYLQFMYERLMLLRQLLTETGVLFLHCNIDRAPYLRAVADEVFGQGAFRNEIVWKRREAHSDTQGIANVHDILMCYCNGDGTLRRIYMPYDEEYVESHYSSKDADGRQYTLADLTAPGPRPGLNYPINGVWPPPGRVWAILPEKAQEALASGRIVFTAEGRPRRKLYLDEMPGMPLHDVWTDVYAVNSQAAEATSYPTQKPEALVERIIQLASNPGDLVLDCFVGSGTTAAVAQKLGRRWIGCDINKGAIQTTAKRLQTIIREQHDAHATAPAPVQTALPGLEAPPDEPLAPSPAQFGFGTWRVNDYDLQIQHNEAVNLVVEHLGVERTRSDPFFDGTLGKTLVKIVPFDHPLSPLDVEEVKREIDSRPDEDRPVTMVALGVELAALPVIDDWNRLRTGRTAINRISYIELRSDTKYGPFLRHQPARADIAILRRKGRIEIEIRDFLSPTIIERLRQQAGVLAPKIEDWRAMVDCVLVDAAYDGRVFNVTLSDVPAKKTDLVSGRYELDAPKGNTTVAVKIVDMLGEEVIVSATV